MGVAQIGGISLLNPKRTWPLCRLILLGILSWLLTIGLHGVSSARAVPGVHSPVLGQFSLPELPTLEEYQLPSDVRRVGGAEIAPVHFQGELLLEIASPSVLDRENVGETLPVEVRAKRIEADLDYVVSFVTPDLMPAGRDYRTVYDPDSLTVQVNRLNNQTIITASDDYREKPQVLATVTETDTEYYGLGQQEVAELWRDRIQVALSEALQERSPQALRSWLLATVVVVAGLIALTFGGWVLHRRLSRAKHQIDQQIAEASTTTGESPPSPPAAELSPEDSPPADRTEQRLALLAQRQQRTDGTGRMDWLNLGHWLLVWGLVLAWVVAIAFLIDRYPLGQLTAWEVLLKPQLILMIWFVTGLGNRLLDFLIRRASGLLPVSATDSAEEIQRRQLRVSTTVNVISGLKTVLLYLLAIFFSLNILGLNTNSLLAFGALLGLAISLATQNVIRDLVNGFLVLLEDQYAIGDVIEIDENTSGLVENLNLRVTQLRDGAGRLITLPNSQISRVVNLTRLWARMDETVCVDANADIHQALDVVKTIAHSIYTDPQFRDDILEAPEVLGVETINHAGVEIHTQTKTKPAQQWTVAREFRLRLKTVLNEKGIAFGRPQREVWHHSSSHEN